MAPRFRPLACRFANDCKSIATHEQVPTVKDAIERVKFSRVEWCYENAINLHRDRDREKSL